LYEALALIPNECSFSLDALHLRLRSRFEDSFAIACHDGYVTLHDASWTLSLFLNSSAYVRDEAKEIVQKFGCGRPDAEALATASRRIELISTDESPEMEHFNDFVYVVEVLQSFPGVAVFEPYMMQFL
jgi:hypothetical protein